MNEKISKAVIARLPKYYRILVDLQDKGVKRVSSKELSAILKSTASQVRQDFNNFGGFGQQGYGYNVDELLNQIQRILGLGSSYKTIIIGSGNIGQALANYKGFSNGGFKLEAMFDLNPKIVGLKVNDVKVLDYSELPAYLEANEVDIAYLAVNEQNAQEVTNVLLKGGVKGIWNFTPVDLEVTGDTVIENVHLIDSLYIMSYYLKGEAR